MKIGDTVYEKYADAKAALEKIMDLNKENPPIKIGEIGDFDLKARSEVAYTSQNGKEKTTVILWLI